jgi:hypothetical protein
MKTIFDKDTRDGIIDRIKTLSPNNTAQWGTMNIYQMLKHCNLAEELYLGNIKHKRMFLGRIFGKWALNGLLRDEAPMRRHAPTSDRFKVTELSGDIETEKKQWITHLEQYADFSTPYFTHWFFGKMTREQIGQLVYKHADHHLRQFNS